MRGGRRPDRKLWSLRLSSSVSPWFRRGLWRTSRSADGRRMSRNQDREKKTEFVSLAISLLLQLVPFIPLCSPLFWFMRARGKVIWGKRTEHWAYVAPQRTLAVLDTIWGSHACGGRGETERSDYKWWLSHLEEQQVQASCGRNGWIDGWRTGSRDGWMVRTIGGEKKRSYMQHLKWRIQLVKAKK